MTIAPPNRLRQIQRAQRVVTQLQESAELNASSQRQLIRAYATRGSLRSLVSSPAGGLSDLLRAFALSGTTDSQQVAAYVRDFKEQDAVRGKQPPPMQLARQLFAEANLKKLEHTRSEAYAKFQAETATVRKQLAEIGADDRDDSSAPAFPLPPYTPDAELGEAFRIFARDELLSKQRSNSAPDGAQDLIDAARYSIDSFERALRYSNATARGTDLTRFRVWIIAHRASTFTMLYWLAGSANPTLELNRFAHLSVADQACLDWLFQQADDGFSRALEELPSYDWGVKFRAVLLALRGGPAGRNGPSDFFRARRLLQAGFQPDAKSNASTEPQAHFQQASFWRSLSTLYAYDTVSSSAPDESVEAAERSINAGIEAVRLDPDEYRGAYFAVASHWFLARKSQLSLEDKAAYEANLQASLDAASVRARNALSQALAALAGLQDLQYLVDETSPRDGVDYYALLDKFHADWESRAIFARDPVSVHAQESPQIRERRLAYLKTFSIPQAMQFVTQFKNDYEGAGHV
jgi:hypothetical protein